MDKFLEVGHNHMHTKSGRFVHYIMYITLCKNINHDLNYLTTVLKLMRKYVEIHKEDPVP